MLWMKKICPCEEKEKEMHKQGKWVLAKDNFDKNL
jgi:hypothetical protein